MVRKARQIMALGVFSVLALAGSSASAQSPWGGINGLGWGYWGGPLYGFANRDYLPYYSLFPPVYYSRPVPRTYGYSPFAYPPGTMTPEIQISEPAEIINPHVPQKSSLTRPELEQTTQAPKVIFNPYVQSPQVASSNE